MIYDRCAALQPGRRWSLEAHQAVIGRFVQRVMLEQLLGAANGGNIVTLLFLQLDEPFKCLEKHLAQAISLREKPVIVTTG